MEWWLAVLPLIGVIVGWGLNEISSVIKHRYEQRKKLRKLLYNLLELRFLLVRKLSAEKELHSLFPKVRKKISELYPSDAAQIHVGIELIKPLITEVVGKMMEEPDRFERVESGLDVLVDELAEFYPIFAYELSGKYDVREQLKNVDEYFSQFDQYLQQFEVDFDFKKFIEPDLSSSLIDDLNKYTLAIAKKIGRKTYRDTKKKIKYQLIDTSSFSQEFDSLFERIKKTLTQS